MSIQSIINNNSVKLLSGLANNDSSIIPMATKDMMSNCAIVHTYKKHGGKDDARERAIEEFGTGVVWLFGIPAVKKVLDLTVYPLLKLNPDLDIRVLKDKDKLKATKSKLLSSTNSALDGEKKIFKTLNDKNKIIKFLSNEQLYKGLFVSKFAISTVLSAIALSKIIDYKQKTTNNRIEKDFYKDHASDILIKRHMSKTDSFMGLRNEIKNNKKNIPFKGALSIGKAFIYNPIVNTSILDGVITSKRVSKARNGERKEVAFKEIFQIIFIYGLAKPIQMLFEKLGSKINTPIGLDPMVLFDKNLNNDLPKAKVELDNILADKSIFKKANNKTNKKLVINGLTADFDKLIDKLYKMDPNSSLLKILEKNGSISAIKDKKGDIQSLSYIKPVDNKKLIKSFTDINELSQNIKSISKVKSFKAFAVLGNVIIAAWIMGVLQPKLNIAMRKVLNNGDNRNPAIVEQEKLMQQKTSDI